MFHYVARAFARHRLYANDIQAAKLWFSLTRAFPDLIALCLMPDHVHLLLPGDDAVVRLGAVMSGHARRVGAQTLWQPAPRPVQIPNAQHARRTLRYVLLNPCRAGLVHDPLAWPWSTHRDRVGVAVPGFGPKERNAAAFHEFVSSDPSCSVAGTPFPASSSSARCVEDILAAVCAVSRCAPSALERRGAPRTLALRAVRRLLPGEYRYAALALGVTTDQAIRLLRSTPDAALLVDPDLVAVSRAVGDPRFRPLREGT